VIKIKIVFCTIILFSIAGYILRSVNEKRNVVRTDEFERIIEERKGLSNFPIEDLSKYRKKIRFTEEQILKTKPLDRMSSLLKPIYSFGHDDEGKLSAAVFCGEAVFFASTTGNIYEINLKEDQAKGRLKLKLGKYSPVAKRGVSCQEKNGKYYLTMGGMNSVLIVDLESSEQKTIKTNGIVAVPPVGYDDSIIFATMNPSRIISVDRLAGTINWELRVSRNYGSNIWSTFVLTEDKRYVIAATGSPFNWEQRKEKYSPDSGAANKILILNPATGKVIFEEQIVESDSWDWDNVGVPIVLESSMNILDFIFFNKGKGIFRRRINISDEGVFVIRSLNTPTLSAHLERKIVFDRENNASYVFGDLPPQLKKTRVIDNYSGGPAWYGAAYSDDRKSIFILENKNLLLGQYFDLIPDARIYSQATAPLKNLKNCFGCHSPLGKVEKSKYGFVPSLSLTSHLHSLDSFKAFMEHSHAPSKFRADTAGLKDLYDSLKILDDKVSKNGYTPYYEFDFSFYINNENYEPRTRGIRNMSSLFGTVSRINVNSLRREWVVPAGRYDNLLKFGEDDFGPDISIGVGSLSWGGLIAHENILILSGTLDSRLWLLNAETGAYFGYQPLPGVGTAPPTKFSLNQKRFVAVPSKNDRRISMTIFQFAGAN